MRTNSIAWRPGFLYISLQCSFLAAFVQGSIPFFDDISHEAAAHVELDYGGQHPFEVAKRQRRSLEEYDETEDAAKQDVSYSTRDSSYAPISIKFDTSLLESRLGESEKRDSVIAEILEALPRAAEQWQKHLYTVSVRSPITVDSDLCFGIYGSALEEISVLGADLVIMVSGEEEFVDYDGVSTFPVCGGSTLALASACSLDQFDRPIVGFMNFCLDHDSTDSVSVNYLQNTFGQFLDVNLNDDHIQIPKQSIAVHELGHVLGFSSWMYKYFRNKDGTPKTPRPFQKQTISCSPDGQKSGVLPSTNTMVSMTDPATGKLSYNIVTPRVSQVTRNLLNCDAVVGARLAEGTECYGSHWHERLFLGELLSPVLTSSSENVLSPLTLGLMEDTGWYRVDYRGIEIPVYGLAAGCEFSTESCIQNDQVPDWGRGMFCNYPLSFAWDGSVSRASLNHIICDPSHRWWTVCDLWDERTVPEGLANFPESTDRYFSNENLVTSFGNADSCPIAVRSLGYDCTQPNDQYSPYYPGETVGANSRCVVASQEVGDGVRSYRPACMATHCDVSAGELVILHGTDEHICQNDGDIIRLVDGSELSCPRLSSICPHLATCPAGCSGRGVCNYETNPPSCVCSYDQNQNEGCYPGVNVYQNEDSPGDSFLVPPVQAPVANNTDVPASGADASSNSADVEGIESFSAAWMSSTTACVALVLSVGNFLL